MSIQELLSRLHENASVPLAQARGADPRIYCSPEIAEMEQARIFRRDWVCPGLAAEISDIGDYMTFSIAGDPVFCIRDRSGAIRTYSNICQHRMMQLLQGEGRVSRIVCPYHAWSYDLDGRLAGAPYMEASEGFNRDDICLPEIRTEVCQGWIYVTLNPDAEPIHRLLEPLSTVVSRYGMEHYVPVLKEEHIWQTNWKLLCENFMESYHLPVAHKATVGAWLELDDSGFPPEVYQDFTYQTFTKSKDATYGVAHPNNTRLDGKWRQTSVMPSVFPSHMYVLAPDHLWYLTLRPRGIGEVDVRFGVAIAPEVDAALSDPAERKVWLKELVKFFEHVNNEDRFVVEGIFAGAQSSLSRSGPLSWLEREIHDFQKYLARRLRSD